MNNIFHNHGRSGEYNGAHLNHIGLFNFSGPPNGTTVVSWKARGQGIQWRQFKTPWDNFESFQAS